MPNRARRLRRWVATLAVALGAVAAPCAAGAPPAPGASFAPFVAELRPGRLVRLPGVSVLAVRAPASAQPLRDAHVGFRGADVQVLALPLPAGAMHVRVSNRGDRALELAAGETLLSPEGPSRSVDRTLWLPPGGAAFVPVVHAEGPPPPGPYLSRGFGLSPLEVQQLTAGTWDERVRARNRHWLVEAKRTDDASAAYATDAFEAAAEPYRKALADLADGATVVGVVVADRRGPYYARIETDAARFRDAWPALAAGIAMDGLLAVAEGRAPAPMHEGALRQQVRALLAPLLAGPAQSRPTFGLGLEVRVPLPDGTGAWEGLEIDGEPIALTLRRQGLPPPGPVPPMPPPPPTPPEDPTPPSPGAVDRDPRPTPFEERWAERREDLGGAVGRGR